MRLHGQGEKHEKTQEGERGSQEAHPEAAVESHAVPKKEPAAEHHPGSDQAGVPAGQQPAVSVIILKGLGFLPLGVNRN
jgi:hypothetical protein